MLVLVFEGVLVPQLDQLTSYTHYHKLVGPVAVLKSRWGGPKVDQR